MAESGNVEAFEPIAAARGSWRPLWLFLSALGLFAIGIWLASDVSPLRDQTERLVQEEAAASLELRACEMGCSEQPGGVALARAKYEAAHRALVDYVARHPR